MTHAPIHAANDTAGWSQDDPHGDHAHPHGHVVVGWRTQVGVLAVLLALTALTVAFYNAEAWAESAFNIHLPGWVNIVGAMAIATVKATLVCMYFMQLRYDKPLNTFVLLFCMLGVGLFLFFSSLDLATRGRVTAFKQDEIVAGGTGVGLDTPSLDERFDARASPHVSTAGQSIATVRRTDFMAAWLEAHPDAGDAEFWAYYYAHVSHPTRHPADTDNHYDRLGIGRDPNAVPTANQSFRRYGRTDALDPNPAPPPAAAH